MSGWLTTIKTPSVPQEAERSGSIEPVVSSERSILCTVSEEGSGSQHTLFRASREPREPEDTSHSFEEIASVAIFAEVGGSYETPIVPTRSRAPNFRSFRGWRRPCAGSSSPLLATHHVAGWSAPVEVELGRLIAAIVDQFRQLSAHASSITLDIDDTFDPCTSHNSSFTVRRPF